MAKKKLRSQRPASWILKTAYHEAGHAVVAEVLGRRVKFVEIDSGGGLMRTQSLPKFDLRRSPRSLGERWEREREAIIYFAGLIAEEGLTGKRTLSGVGNDFDAVERILRHRHAREAEVTAYGRWLYERSVSILQKNWAAVERLAEALATVRKINGKTVRKLIGKIQTERL